MKTKDLFFASYLRLKGYKIKDFEVITRGKGVYEFDISESDWKVAKMEFLESDLSKAKQIMEELKDLVY